MLHDLSFVDRRQRTARDFVLVFVGISVWWLALRMVLVAGLQLRRWVQVLIGDIRGKRFLDDAESPRASLPILSQVRKVLAEAEETQRLEIDFHENWTPQALRQVVRDHLHSAQVIIVSNREPYIHNFDANNNPIVQVPASGMVTALEPIMRACSGVWVAHGAGTADRETVDRYDQIRVPPDDPSYTLRRVWLTEAQEQGYYYGFCNEGLWALCHLAYVRPAFRASDWHSYGEVNEKFADVVAAESNTDSPVILIQDFHFALLPHLLRRKIPKATIVLFWHIPWPNAETFGVCPWKREMLMYMLSADILGFPTRHHSQTSLTSIDRDVERINAKFGEGDWRPIVLIDEHQEPLRIFELYRAADFCLVNSLHDGMNLVAKEFVAARDDEDGVLILSTFAGASRELAEAVLINPFDVTETAEAIEIAMRMGRDERRNRMSLMRRTVKESNVYRWAGRMLMDAARIPQRQSLRSAPRRLATWNR